jgi:hypothetical protein
MRRLRLRPFACEDVVALEGARPDGPVAGLTALIGAEVVGYGGLAKSGGRHWGFFLVSATEAGQALRNICPRLLHRLALQMLQRFDAVGIAEVHALCDERYPRAAAWLAALGFRRLPDDEKPPDIAAFEAARGGHDTWLRPNRTFRQMGGRVAGHNAADTAGAGS